jgi:hypothetical protein
VHRRGGMTEPLCQHRAPVQLSMNAPRPPAKRKIYFYRVDAGLLDNGSPVPFDPVPVLQHIEALPFPGGDRYWEAPDGNATCCWVEPGTPLRRMRIGSIRRGDLPQVEQDGALSPLPIPATSGLVEHIHVIFFPDNIVGSEFNFYGPRISRLKHYLDEKAEGVCPPLTFQPLMRGDVAEQLGRLKHVSLFELKILAPFAESLRKADESLFRAVNATLQAGDAEEVEIIMKKKHSSPKWLNQDLVQAALRILRLPGVREGVSHFVVKGLDEETHRVTEVDVLSDKLISVKKIVRQGDRSRALDSEAAYQAIEEAHSELRDQLIEAIGVRT